MPCVSQSAATDFWMAPHHCISSEKSHALHRTQIWQLGFVLSLNSTGLTIFFPWHQDLICNTESLSLYYPDLCRLSISLEVLQDCLVSLHKVVDGVPVVACVRKDMNVEARRNQKWPSLSLKLMSEKSKRLTCSHYFLGCFPELAIGAKIIVIQDCPALPCTIMSSATDCTAVTKSGTLHLADIRLKDMSCGISGKLTKKLHCSIDYLCVLI